VSEEKQQRVQRNVPEGMEKRGLVQDVVQPLLTGGAAGAASAWAQSKLSKKDPPPGKKE
jgi:hypothetical protein